MAGPYQASILGHAVRLYKNASNDLIAVDEIVIHEASRTQKKDGSYFISGSMRNHRNTMYIGTSPSDRTVASIEMMGDYASYNSGKQLLIWVKESNNIEILLTSLAQIGEQV